MKRIVSLVIALSMVLSLFGSVFAAGYTDLTGENAKYASAVDALTELKVIDGFPDETFRPNEELTRAQVAKMLVICLGFGDQVESLSTKTVFSDVASNHWAAGYINAAAQSKIIVGYPDGTFQPEKTVTYAEAFTMALRALGYGNVVEAEGTWPTAYMLKAVELELTDDMDGVAADKAATRGNTAILLWNMLRTPMWKIYEESQGNGMTMTARDDFMLNVKFPKYEYLEEVYLADVTVDNGDSNKVKATLVDEKDKEIITAYVHEDTDISRLVAGTKVSSLIKEYKDADKATFLTLTKEYSFVEGLVTDASKLEEGKIEIENVEYKLDTTKYDFNKDLEIAENSYVVAEVDGKKIVGFGDEAVLKTLPNEGKEVTKPSTLRSKIDEDALVIIDGKWATRDDIEEGDVYTEIVPGTNDIHALGDNYYMVARERVEGTFESLTYEKDDDQRMYFEVDGDEHRTFEDMIEGNVYEGEDKDKVEDAVEKLTKKKSDNDYLDKDIELVLNYLGQVVKAYFGDVKGNGNGNNFFAVMSNGIRKITDPETGDSALKIRLANGDDTEGTMYKLSTKFKLADFEGTPIEEDVVFENAEGDDGKVVFVWAKFNDKDEIKSLAVLEAGLSGDVEAPFSYDDDYAFAEFTTEYDKDSGYIKTDDGEYKVTGSTVVYKLTPVEDEEDDAVVGFNFEVAEDAKAALSGVDNGLVAYDTTTKINKNANKMTASFVFIMEDAVSSELEVAKVEKVRERAGISYVMIDGEWEEVDLENKKSIVDAYQGGKSGDVKELDKQFIAFSRTENEKIVIKGEVTTTDIAEASIVQAVEGSIVQLVEGPLSGDIDLESKDDEVNKKYEDYQVVHIDASVNKDNEVEFEDGEALGTGLPAGKYSKGDRVYVDDELEVIYIVTVEGVDDEDLIEDVDGVAKVTYKEDLEEEETTGDNTGDNTSAGSGDNTGAGSGDNTGAGSTSGDGTL
jgi:hypothetical protein